MDWLYLHEITTLQAKKEQRHLKFLHFFLRFKKKLNYCLKSLKDKGLIKIENFKKNPKKINYIYMLTPKGISAKTKLTINFMKRKMREYDELKKEIEE